MNDWLKKKHIRQREDYSFNTRHNYNPVVLTWEGETSLYGMPILRNNWAELESQCHAHWTLCELEQHKVMKGWKKWENAYTSL